MAKGSLVHAYLIFAHKNLDQLVRLVRRLDTGRAYFFIHIDQKTDTTAYSQELGELSKLPQVQFVKRYHCPWAAFGIIKAQKTAMEAALRADTSITHLTLLTGQDYPIRPPREIDSFFEAHEGTSFIGYGAKLQKRRYSDIYFYFAGRHWHIPLSRVGIEREAPGGMEVVKGWAFFTLSRECVEYALNFVRYSPRYVRFFRYAKHADEYFWHTILFNSPLKQTIANVTLRYERFADKTGHVKVLRKEHLAEIKASDYFFAKKFDTTVDPDILDLIDRDILKVANA
jgi:hypothetical protein